MSEGRFKYDETTMSYLDTEKPLNPAYQTATIGGLVAAYETLEADIASERGIINCLITSIEDIRKNNGVWTANDRGGGNVFSVEDFCKHTLMLFPRRPE